jgi:hypothetical protein
MTDVLQEQMVAAKADEALEQVVLDLIDNSRIWDRGMSREDIVKIVMERAQEISIEEPEDEL